MSDVITTGGMTKVACTACDWSRTGQHTGPGTPQRPANADFCDEVMPQIRAHITETGHPVRVTLTTFHTDRPDEVSSMVHCPHGRNRRYTRMTEWDAQERWDTAIHRLYDTTGTTTSGLVEGVDYHVVGSNSESAEPGPRVAHGESLCITAWNMVNALSAEDPRWVVEDIRECDDLPGLVLTLAQMLTDTHQLVSDASWQQFVTDNGGPYRATLPGLLAQIEQERSATV